MLKSLKRHKDAYPFLLPVDYVKLNIPDYPSIITQPMDLSSIDKKLTTGIYSEGNEFIADVRLMFNNCYKYNGEESAISKLAQNLERIFDSQLKKMPQDVQFVNCPHFRYLNTL
jgi:bromodomain-containing factor 1